MPIVREYDDGGGEIPGEYKVLVGNVGRPDQWLAWFGQAWHHELQL